MSKLIEFNQEARNKLKEGANKLAKAVVSTLGPFGRNVIIEKDGELPVSTKDGVTVARSISLEDPIENIGAEIIKQASIRSADQAGDGTTTTTLLAASMINDGMKYLDKGINAVQLKKGIDAGVNEVIEYIAANFIEKISSPDQFKQVATISSNNDENIGNLISQALDIVGGDGVVSIEESKTGDTYLETVMGMQFARGYKSPHFVTNNAEMNSVLTNCRVFLYDGMINTAKDLIPLLTGMSTADQPVLIVAQDIEGEALATLIVNKIRGNIKACAVKAPEFGDRRTLFMEDIAILTGGTVLSKDKGNKLSSMTMTDLEPMLGTARTITINKDETTIIEGKGDIDQIEKRVNDLKIQIDATTSSFEKERLQERLANLVSGIAIIYVGGNNEIELKEIKDRVEDALYATKAAISKGIVPGGGVTLLNAQKAIKVLEDNTSLDLGKQIVRRALCQPFLQILENAGIENPQQIMYELLSKNKKNHWIGYDIQTKKFIDYKENGIIDPYKVIFSSLKNAAAVVGTFLTTEAVVYSKPSSEEKSSPNDLGMQM
jgi:chaperonin GroEL